MNLAREFDVVYRRRVEFDIVVFRRGRRFGVLAGAVTESTCRAQVISPWDVVQHFRYARLLSKYGDTCAIYPRSEDDERRHSARVLPRNPKVG